MSSCGNELKDALVLLTDWAALVASAVPGPVMHAVQRDLIGSLTEPVLLAPRDSANLLVDRWLATDSEPVAEAVGALLTQLQPLLGDDAPAAILVRPIHASLRTLECALLTFMSLAPLLA